MSARSERSPSRRAGDICQVTASCRTDYSYVLLLAESGILAGDDSGGF